MSGNTSHISSATHNHSVKYMIIPLDLIIHYAVGFPYAMKYLVPGGPLGTDPSYRLSTLHTHWLCCHPSHSTTCRGIVVWNKSYTPEWKLLFHLQPHINTHHISLYTSDRTQDSPDTIDIPNTHFYITEWNFIHKKRWYPFALVQFRTELCGCLSSFGTKATKLSPEVWLSFKVTMCLIKLATLNSGSHSPP